MTGVSCYWHNYRGTTGVAKRENPCQTQNSLPSIIKGMDARHRSGMNALKRGCSIRLSPQPLSQTCSLLFAFLFQPQSKWHVIWFSAFLWQQGAVHGMFSSLSLNFYNSGSSPLCSMCVWPSVDVSTSLPACLSVSPCCVCRCMCIILFWLNANKLK